MHKLKIEAQKQWNADACGADTASGVEEGSWAFFEAVERYRYADYAPWIPGVVGFERFCGKNVLEIGPGLGTDLVQFASHGARTVAMDLARRHLDHTRRNLRFHSRPASCILGDAEALPFRSGAFDCVYAFGVLHHTPDVKLAVKEMHRVLRTGGRAIVGLYHRDSAFYWVYTILIRGLWRMGLFKKGYRHLMSEIEHRSENSDALPLVKVYSRGQTRELFGGFRQTKIHTYHLEYGHFLPARLVKGFLPFSWQRREFVERFARYFGWFLMVEAEK